MIDETHASDNVQQQAWVDMARHEYGIPRYRTKQELPMRLPADRGSIRKSFARAAAFCRYVPELAPGLKRQLMSQALDQGGSRLRNRLLAKKASWVRAGMPKDLLPWEAVVGR